MEWKYKVRVSWRLKENQGSKMSKEGISRKHQETHESEKSKERVSGKSQETHERYKKQRRGLEEAPRDP
ncbi:hypothetical protein ACQCVK_05510 [Rossellomorea vietnamensis]